MNMDIRDNGISEFVMNCISFDYMIFAVSGKFPDNTAEELRAKQDGMQIWFKESFLKSNKLSGPSHILVLNDKDPDYNPSASSASADISLKEKNDPSLPAAAKKSNSNTLETDESKILKQMNKNPKAEENKNIEESKKQDLEKPAAAMALLMKKYDIFREENAENIRLNFRLHNSSVISAVFPKTFKLEDLYEFVNYRTQGIIKDRFQIITDYPDERVLPPNGILLKDVQLVMGQTLFIRVLI